MLNRSLLQTTIKKQEPAKGLKGTREFQWFILALEDITYYQTTTFVLRSPTSTNILPNLVYLGFNLVGLSVQNLIRLSNLTYVYPYFPKFMLMLSGVKFKHVPVIWNVQHSWQNKSTIIKNNWWVLESSKQLKGGLLFPCGLTHIVHKEFLGLQEILLNIYENSMSN